MTESANPLPDFEGQPVIGAALRITNAGDGLSEALELGPKTWHHRDEIYLVLKATVTQVNHKAADKDGEKLIRVHTASAVGVTEVQAADIEGFLEAAEDRLRKARDEKSGQQNLIDQLADAAEAEDMAPAALDEFKQGPAGKRGALHIESDDGHEG